MTPRDLRRSLMAQSAERRSAGNHMTSTPLREEDTCNNREYCNPLCFLPSGANIFSGTIPSRGKPCHGGRICFFLKTTLWGNISPRGGEPEKLLRTPKHAMSDCMQPLMVNTLVQDCLRKTACSASSRLCSLAVMPNRNKNPCTVEPRRTNNIQGQLVSEGGNI